MPEALSYISVLCDTEPEQLLCPNLYQPQLWADPCHPLVRLDLGGWRGREMEFGTSTGLLSEGGTALVLAFATT